MPKGWRKGVLALLHKGHGAGFASLRPLELVSASEKVVASAILDTMGDDLGPQRLNGYANCRGCRIDLAMIPLRIVVEKRTECGSVDYLTMWKGAKAKAGTRKAWFW